jgi:hypothetical protein
VDVRDKELEAIRAKRSKRDRGKARGKGRCSDAEAADLQPDTKRARPNPEDVGGPDGSAATAEPGSDGKSAGSATATATETATATATAAAAATAATVSAVKPALGGKRLRRITDDDEDTPEGGSDRRQPIGDTSDAENDNVTDGDRDTQDDADMDTSTGSGSEDGASRRLTRLRRLDAPRAAKPQRRTRNAAREDKAGDMFSFSDSSRRNSADNDSLGSDSFIIDDLDESDADEDDDDRDGDGHSRRRTGAAPGDQPRQVIVRSHHKQVKGYGPSLDRLLFL